MDKNTRTGFLLMLLVLLLFWWLQKPSDKQEQQALAEQEALEQTDDLPNSSENVLTIDSVSPSELAVIRSSVKEFGVADTVGGTLRYTLKTPNATVELDNATGALSGTVNAGGAAVPVADILAASYPEDLIYAAPAAVKALKSDFASLARYKGFARSLAGDSTTVTLKNDVLELAISTKGAQIAEATLLDPRYVSYDSTAVKLLAPDYGGYSFTLSTSSQRIETRDLYFKPVEVSDTAVMMAAELGDGAYWGIRYTLQPGESYTVGMQVVQSGLAKTDIIPANVASMGFTWHQKMPRNEAGRKFEERNSALYYMKTNGGVDNLSENSNDDEQLTNKLQWIGFKNQFFSAVFVSHESFTSANLDSKVLDDDMYIKELTADASLDYSRDAEAPAEFTIFLGPNLYPLLNDLEDEIIPDTDLKLTKLIPLGWPIVRWINTLIIIPVFTLLSKFIGNYGIIILLLTIFIKIILFPFTYKSYMSQAKMRVLAPEIKEINEKYPNQEDAVKRQQATMDLYSRAGANPMSGCLPLLLQMPILIAMFNFFPSAIELRGEPFLWAHDLSAPDAIIPLYFNIPFLGNHLSIFCLLMTITNVLYSYYNMQSQPGGNAMPGMKWMTMLMPIMFLFIFNDYAAGLSYYYFLSLLITIIQMWAFRRVVDEDKVRAQMAENAKKPKKKSGFMARLEEAQKRQEQLMREQARQNAKRRK